VTSSSSSSGKITFLPLCAGYFPLMNHHRVLLDDRVRTEAFIRAIEKVVKRGDTVIDLGAGSGILSAKAAQAGAKKVYALEATSMIEVARGIFEENGLSETITAIRGRSTNILSDLRDVKANVIVSECFGPMAVGGTMIEAVAEARDRWLAPQGTMIPESVDVFIAPVESPECNAFVSTFHKSRYGLSMKTANHLARNNTYNAEFDTSELLAPPGHLRSIDFRTFTTKDPTQATAFTKRVHFTTHRAGVMHGYAGWFTSKLAPKIFLDTSPSKPSTVWRQVFFPLSKPTRLKQGTPIDLDFKVTPSKVPEHTLYWDWTTSIAEKHRFEQSTRLSFPAVV
jgi:predicted RNA methylase